MNRQTYLENNPSTPPLGLLTEPASYRWVAKWIEIYVKLAASKGTLSSIKFHKWKLGKQDFCWTGSARNWIWERDGYRLFISKKGVSMEVFEDITEQEIFDCLEDYKKAIGL